MDCPERGEGPRPTIYPLRKAKGYAWRLALSGLAVVMLLGIRMTQANTSPPARASHAMTYANGATLLFGGEGCGSACDDTWQWNGSAWVQASPAAFPPAREYHALAYDSGRGRAVLFGGCPNFYCSVIFGDTWEWDGTTWTQAGMDGGQRPAIPPARAYHALAYDSAHNNTVLFGGYAGAAACPPSGYCNDTWTWNGSEWTQANPAVSPSARVGHALAYDGVRGVIVLFGGYDSAGQLLNDTWEWNGTVWAQRNPALAPPRRAYHALAYDSARGVAVLFGGAGDCGGYCGDTWEWNGSAWAQRSTGLQPTTPPARQRHALAYDSIRGVTVLFGGEGLSGLLSDTWEWDGATWTQPIAQTPTPTHTPNAPTVTPTPTDRPAARQAHALVYDAQRQRTTLFGGCLDIACAMPYDDTWEWNGSAWAWRPATPRPPARSSYGLAYDGARHLAVLFGGLDRFGGRLGDTWEWNGAAWTERTPSMSPPGRYHHALAYDGARNFAVLFGGNGMSDPDLGDTWEWDGMTWVQRTPPASPPERQSHALAYDSSRGFTVLFGGFNADLGYLGDTWEWNGATWAQRTLAVTPPPRRWHALAYDSQRQVTVLFGGANENGDLGDTWEWNGTAWAQRCGPDPFPIPCAPAPRNQHALAYDSQAHLTLLFGGYSNGALMSDTWAWDGNAWIPLYAAATPTPTATPGSNTPGPSPTPSASRTPAATQAWTGTPPATSTVTRTPTHTATALNTSTLTPTRTPTSVTTATQTPTPLPTHFDLFLPITVKGS